MSNDIDNRDQAAELKAMTRLHELSTRLLGTTELQPMLEEVLDATMALLNADLGNVQLYNSKTKALEIVAQRGFRQDFLDHFSSVSEDSAACGRALCRGERTIIEDVLTDPDFAPHRAIAASAGFRAVQSTPMFSRSGRPLGMFSTHFRQPHRPPERDLRMADLYARLAANLIERKQTEEALRESEARFRSYFELGLIGMAMTSPSKGCLEVNDELCRILGYERNELLQKTWAEMTHPDDLAADVAQFNRVLAGEIDGYTLDKRWIRKDGQAIDSIMAAKCMRNDDGSVDYFVGLVLDTTERKRAEKSLREAHQRAEMILDSITDRFFLVDKEWRYTQFNKHAEEQLRILGKDPASLIGKVLWDEFPSSPAEERIRWAMRERVPITHQHYYPPLGEWVENRSYPSPDGGLAMFIGYITDHKRAEEELRKTQEELTHVARVTTLGELTASIAHEVNQPLGAIVTNAQASLRLLSSANPDLNGVREAVEAMVVDSMRASEVIKRIRSLLKKTVPEQVEFNVNEAIRNVVALTSSELSQSEVQLQTDLASDLAPVVGDRVQLQQVVLNLILNSKEAMSQTGWQPRDLLIRSEPNGPEEVLVTVRDTGIGVDSEKRDSVFDPFFTSKEGGLGLGLSISRTIIEAHGGKLWTKPNNSGPGAKFQFTLPSKEAFAGETQVAVAGR